MNQIDALSDNTPDVQSLDELLTEVQDRTDRDMVERLSDAIDTDKRKIQDKLDAVSRLWNRLQEIKNSSFDLTSDECQELLRINRKLDNILGNK